MTDILSLLPEELPEMGQSFRAAQLFHWLHARRVGSFEEMHNLPASMREGLADKFFIPSARPVRTQKSADGTVKHLHMWGSASAESVVMEYHHGRSLCISTQAGCRMGCVFCMSGANGLDRDLTPGEMLAQVYAAHPVNSLVLMGCGEPLDNFENVIKFLRLVSHEKGMNLGMRHITLSTCGLVPEIYRLAACKLQLTLAVSLHAPTDDLRRELMPAAYPLAELLSACRFYVNETGRRISFEYTLINGVNSDKAHAVSLAALLRGMNCHVNLIPVNSGSGMKPASRDMANTFLATLQGAAIPATLRRSLGADIAAACGMLRKKGG